MDEQWIPASEDFVSALSAVWKVSGRLEDAEPSKTLPSWEFYCFEKLPSTMDAPEWCETEKGSRAMEVAGAILRFPSPESTETYRVYVSGEQQSGRGREGRTWVSQPGKGLYVSFSFPSFAAENVSGYSLLVGLAAVDCLAGGGISALIKWPNDVYAGVPPRKLGGILVDFRTLGERKEVLVGIGLNLLAQGEDFAGLEELSPEPVDYFCLLASLCRKLHHRTAEFLESGFQAVQSECNRHSLLQGKHLTVETPSGVVEGRMCGIADDGALLIETGTGVQKIYSGSVLGFS